jgi:hypothetical protein
MCARSLIRDKSSAHFADTVDHRVGFFFEEGMPHLRAVVAITAASGVSERRQAVGVGPHGVNE